jgi:hypothetical protein
VDVTHYLSLVSEMDEFVEVEAEFGKLVHVRQHGGKAAPEGVFVTFHYGVPSY